MALWQRINIVSLPSMPLASQQLNDEIFNIYDKLNYLRTLGMGMDKPQSPIEGELYNDGEKINIYLGPGLGPKGDGFVPLAYIDPDNRYPLKEEYDAFKTSIENSLDSINSSLSVITTSISSLDSRVGTIEDVNIPNINNRLDSHDATLAQHTTQIDSISLTANSAYTIATNASITANNALANASLAQQDAQTAIENASIALSTAQQAANLAFKKGYKAIGYITWNETDVSIYNAVNISSVTVAHYTNYTALTIYFSQSIPNNVVVSTFKPLAFNNIGVHRPFWNNNYVYVLAGSFSFSVSGSSVIVTTQSVSVGAIFLAVFNSSTSPQVW